MQHQTQQLLRQRSFTVDANAPELITPNVNNGSWWNSATVNFNWTATNTGTSPLYCNLTVDGAVNKSITAASGVMANATVEGLSNGMHTWYSNCSTYLGTWNTTGTMSPTVQALYVDTLKPHTIALNSLDNGLNTTSTTLNFNWTASDAFNAFAATMTCNLTIDSVINKTVTVTNGTMANYSITGFADGIHYWNISSCNDSALNKNITGSETRYFTVDTVNVNDITPTIINNSNFSSSTVYINWTVTDATSTVVNCSLVVDNALNLTAWKEASATGASASQSVAGLSEGWHTWYVNCTDIVGNKNATGSLSPLMRSFYVDLTDPVPTLTLSSTSINLRATETITCTAQDRGAASPASFTVKLPSGDYSSDLDGTFTDTSLVGTYTVVCSTTDASGRSPTPATSTFTAGSEVNANTGSTGGSSSAPTASSSTTLSVLPDVPGIVTVSNSQIAVNEVALDVSGSSNRRKDYCICNQHTAFNHTGFGRDSIQACRLQRQTLMTQS